MNIINGKIKANKMFPLKIALEIEFESIRRIITEIKQVKIPTRNIE
jgi:hypothetical protein